MKIRTAFLIAMSLAITGPLPAAAGMQRISAADKQAGARSHADMLRQYGPAMTGPAAAFLEKVGRRIGVQSGLSATGDDFTVTLLDSSDVNAFATTGGYIYATRGLIALVNDEAELAAVLGHEVGHVAKHHVRAGRRTAGVSRVLVGMVGLTLGSGFQNLAGYGANLLVMGFSRADEYQADDLGVRYLAAANYDPSAAADMLSSLERYETVQRRITAADAEIAASERDHPYTADRIARARALAQQSGRAGQGERGRAAYLAAIEGLTFGDDPAYGVQHGLEFQLPAERIAFTVPPGMALSASDGKVMVAGARVQAVFQAEWFDYGTTLDKSIDEIFTRMGDIHHLSVQRGTVNDLAIRFAPGRAETAEGPVDIDVIVYSEPRNKRTYSLVTTTPAGSGLGPFASMVGSVRRIPVTEAIDTRPISVSIIDVAVGDSVDSLVSLMSAFDRGKEQLLLLNGFDPSTNLRPGDKVKILVRR